MWKTCLVYHRWKHSTRLRFRSIGLSLAEASINIAASCNKEGGLEGLEWSDGEGGDLGLTGGPETCWLTLSSEAAHLGWAFMGFPPSVWIRVSVVPGVAVEPFQLWQ